MTDKPNAPKPNNHRGKRTGTNGPRRKGAPKRGPRTISNNVGKAYLEADAEKRRRAAEAMARIAVAKK